MAGLTSITRLREVAPILLFKSRLSDHAYSLHSEVTRPGYSRLSETTRYTVFSLDPVCCILHYLLPWIFVYRLVIILHHSIICGGSRNSSYLLHITCHLIRVYLWSSFLQCSRSRPHAWSCSSQTTLRLLSNRTKCCQQACTRHLRLLLFMHTAVVTLALRCKTTLP